jgi:hypothetical protein
MKTEGPAEAWASHPSQPCLALPRGTKGSIPKGMRSSTTSLAGRRARCQASTGQSGSCRLGTNPRSPFPSLAQTLSSRSTREGSDYGRVRAAGRIRTSRTHPVMSASLRSCGVLSRGGWSPASKTGAKQMSRKDAHAFAASLAATLMVSIVVFQAGDGTYGAVPADEIDGDEVVIVSEYDPFG